MKKYGKYIFPPQCKIEEKRLEIFKTMNGGKI